MKLNDTELEALRAAVQSLRSIQEKKNLRNLTSEEIKKAEPLARVEWKKIREKSPFFRAWFGDWRANDKTPINISTLEKGKSFKAGKAVNTDTQQTISWGSVLPRETKHYEKAMGIATDIVGNIEGIVKNAVFLDSEVSLLDSKTKMPGTAFMHYFYSLAEIEGDVWLLKLNVEESLSNIGEVFTRAYSLKDIKIVAMPDGSVLSNKGGLTAADTATINTVADLFALVKQHDKFFKPGESSKIVNEDGTPRIVYHGTDADFTVFDRTKKHRGRFSVLLLVSA